MVREIEGSPVNDVSVKKNGLLVYVLKLTGILGGRCGSVSSRRVTTLKTAARETIGRKVRIRKVQDRPCVAIFFLFDRNTLNNRSNNF